MNPFPVVFSMIRRQRFTLFFFVVLVTFAVALGVAMTAQERALRQGSARASDKFDLLVGAPGSQYDLVLSAVYLRLGSMELLAPEVFAELLEDDNAEWVAPIAFGDSAGGYPVVGTTAQLITHLSGALSEGRLFEAHEEAVVGADVSFGTGEYIQTAHGAPGVEEHLHEDKVAVVGRMAPTGTPWDRAIIVPVELTWEMHGLPNGHEPEVDEHEDEAHDHAGNEVHKVLLGAPFDPRYLPGVPAVVVKPADLPAAYGLRNAYRTERSQALFPAEILVQLYVLMGDARSVLDIVTVTTQLLVVAAILSGLMIMVQLYNSRLATLRALGAIRFYVFLVAWTFLTGLIVLGSIAGIALGYLAAGLISTYLTSIAGFRISAGVGTGELTLVGVLLLIGAAFAVLPAFILFRRPVTDGLRT